MDLIIGTATFGTDYGIANKGKIVTESMALEILSEAQNIGIKNLDTAPVYSNAEEIIGRYHSTHSNFDCYSKISSKLLDSKSELNSSLINSMNLMQIKYMKGLYFHNAKDVLERNPKYIESLIDTIYATQKVEKIGVSVYELAEILEIRDRHPRISLFQVPENLGDQRLRFSNEMMNLHTDGIEFHVRSVFLQGLLLMRTAPSNLFNAQPFLNKLISHAQKLSSSPLKLCIDYSKQLKWASKIVIGISHKSQLGEIVAATKYPVDKIELNDLLPDEIRDPRKWTHV